jgi:hypothetical protein
MLEELLDKSCPTDLKAQSKPITLTGIEYIVEESVIGWYGMLAQRSHELPALLVLVLAAASLK